MALNLALSIPRNGSCGSYGQTDCNLVEGFDPSVQLRETRSSYFLDVNLPGLRKEDIWLQMNNTRTLIIRGQRYLHNMGMVEWTWHLVQRGSSRRRPFRIPNDVNVAAVTASFHHGVLHVVMPKFRWNRFSPYQVINRAAQDCYHQLQLYPPIGPAMLQPGPNLQPQNTEQSGQQAQPAIVCEVDDEEFEKMQEVDHMEIESLKPGHSEETQISVVITVEEQCMEIPPQDCPSYSSEQQLIEDLIKKKDEAALSVSPSENPPEKQPDNSVGVKDADEMGEATGSFSKEEIVKEIEAQEAINGCSPRSVSKEEIVKEIEAQETRNGCSSDTSTVSNLHEEERTAPSEEKDGHNEKGKEDRIICGNEQVKSERVEESQPVLRKGLSHLFSCITEIAARKFRRG